jgi:hypothetical protein
MLGGTLRLRMNWRGTCTKWFVIEPSTWPYRRGRSQPTGFQRIRNTWGEKANPCNKASKLQERAIS